MVMSKCVYVYTCISNEKKRGRDLVHQRTTTAGNLHEVFINPENQILPQNMVVVLWYWSPSLYSLLHQSLRNFYLMPEILQTCFINMKPEWIDSRHTIQVKCGGRFRNKEWIWKVIDKKNYTRIHQILISIIQIQITKAARL